MSEMKTVTIGGVTYTVRDPDALSGTDTTLSVPNKAADAAAVGEKMLPKTGGTMSGTVDMGGNRITGLGEPAGDRDASTVQYAGKIAAAYGLAYLGNVTVNNIDSLTTQGIYSAFDLNSNFAVMIVINQNIGIFQFLIPYAGGSVIMRTKWGSQWYGWHKFDGYSYNPY